MTTLPLPLKQFQVDEKIAAVVRGGLSSRPKQLPPWLFYDAEGSRLFEQITELPEYYLTRTERAILEARSGEILALAAATEGEPVRLRITELGAGSADKTRLLLSAAIARQGTVTYEPVDVSATALDAAKERIEQEIEGVRVTPRFEDYTGDSEPLELDAVEGERRLVLYIGSSIGNFEPTAAQRLLHRVREALQPGDALLLGVDLVKEESILLAAYDDAAGVTAAFNRNLLTRLNRELAADFDARAFAHRALWNAAERRIEMHLESLDEQRVTVTGLEEEIGFKTGETIHTESSYKYLPGEAETMLEAAGFEHVESWTDQRGWFEVSLSRIGDS